MIAVKISIVEQTYQMDEDGQFVCAHESAYIEKACCSPFQLGSSGYIECGCGGRDSIICPNQECTGFTEEDMVRLEGEL